MNEYFGYKCWTKQYISRLLVMLVQLNILTLLQKTSRRATPSRHTNLMTLRLVKWSSWRNCPMHRSLVTRKSRRSSELIGQLLPTLPLPTLNYVCLLETLSVLVCLSFCVKSTLMLLSSSTRTILRGSHTSLKVLEST